MPKYVEPMTEDFIRQRRNLIIASCIIWLFHFGNVTINTVTYSDIEIRFGNKDALYTALWIYYFYALFRFFVYFVEDGWEAFIFSFQKVLDESLHSGFFKVVESDNYNNLSCCEMKLEKTALNFKTDTGNLKISYFKIFPAIVLSFLKFIFLRMAITDYIFPLLLSIYVLVNSGMSAWDGSLIKMLGD